MKKVLVVVDMQNDFIDGTLGTKEAKKIVPNVAEKIRNFDGDVYGTMDTHGEDYLDTLEGKNLPVEHCVYEEHGWSLNNDIADALINTKGNVHKFCKKSTFGSTQLAHILAKEYLGEEVSIEFIGLCTDICVISNVMIMKAVLPEARFIVDASCCAGVTPESHQNALKAMEACQIEIVNK